MTRITKTLLLSAIISTALWAAPSFAEMKGSEGTGEAPRGADLGAKVDLGKAKPIAVPKVEGEQSRAPITDEKAAVESYSVFSRAADGKETHTAPNEAFRKIIIDTINAPAKKADGKASKQSAADPALTEGDEADRQVFGNDERTQIKNSSVYPFRTVGYIQGKIGDGFSSCSGTLIGPRTVLTAAHCLYSNEDKAWLDEVVYVPALNGESSDNTPFGVYAAESTSVVEGFVKNYQGSYDSSMQWDLGLITLAEPIGDNLGWLQPYNFEDMSDFDANIVGYPGDKPLGTMWRATCRVIVEAIGPDSFEYDCDTYPGSSGSSVYLYDAGSKQRIVTGVNIAESQNANTALRLNATYMAWIESLWK